MKRRSRVPQVPFAAQARCWPAAFLAALYPFEPVYFVQTPKEVWMMWQRDHMVRRIYLKDKHSANVKPDWFGELIGHYENGDTLVVDTIGFSTKNSYIDNFRTPHTEKLHVVERFTVSQDGKNLTALATVEDPDTFNAPLTMQATLVQGERADGRNRVRGKQRGFLPSEPVSDA